MRAVSLLRIAALGSVCALPFALTACDTMTPSSASADLLARQPKVEVCHLDDEGAYELIEIAAPALDGHLGHGDGQVGDPVQGQDGFEFDEACQPVASVVTVDACYTSGEFQADLTIDLSTGEITSTDACNFFEDCSPSGSVSPVPVASFSEITGFVYEEVDQSGSGCPDAFVSTYDRSDGDVFQGTTAVRCGIETIDSFNNAAMLSEGACPVDGARPAALVAFERELARNSQ